MSAEVGSIFIKFAADFGSYEAALRKGEKTTNGFSDRAGKAVGSLESRFKSLASVTATFGKGLLAGIAAGGITTAVKGLADVAKGVAEIGDAAKRAGVSSTIFQEWTAVARNARIPVDSLADGLKELSLRGDEFAVTGSGAAADAFRRLGYGAAELKAKLADPSALMLEIIDRLGKMDRAAQIRISDELFGGNAGEKFVQLIDQGSQGIRETIAQAHALGNVLSDDVITRAAEVDRQFQIISTTVGTNLKGAIVNAAFALQQFIDSFRSFDAQQTASLEAQFTSIGKQRLEIENQILKVQDDQRQAQAAFGPNTNAQVYAAQIADLRAEQAALSETEKKIMAVTEARKKAASVTPAAQGPGAQGPAFVPAPYKAPAVKTSGDGGRGPSTRTASASSADSEAKAVRDLIESLQQELALVGATDLQRQTANALRRAGAGATAEQKAQIVSLVASINAEAAATQKATDAAEEMRAISRDILSGIVSDFRAGKSAAEVFAGVLDKIIDKLSNMAIDGLLSSFGKGAGKGLLGGVLIPGILHGGGDADRAPKVAIRHSGGDMGSPRGIKHGEVLTLLEKTETVFTKEQTNDIGKALAAKQTDGKKPSPASNFSHGDVVALSAKSSTPEMPIHPAAQPDIRNLVTSVRRADLLRAGTTAKPGDAVNSKPVTAAVNEPSMPTPRVGGLFGRGISDVFPEVAKSGSIWPGIKPIGHTTGNAGMRVRNFAQGDQPQDAAIKPIIRHTGGDAGPKSGIGHGEVIALLEKTEKVFTGKQTNRIGQALEASTHQIQSGPSRLKVDVGVAADQNGNLMPFVAKVSQAAASGAVKAASPEIVKAATANVRSQLRNNPGFAR